MSLDAKNSSGGYNTREEPRDLAVNECQMLVNQFPGSPSPRPCPGISYWGRGSTGTGTGRSANLIELIGFRRIDDSLVLEVYANGVRAVSKDGSKNYLVSDSTGGAIPGPQSGSVVSYVRIESSVVAFSNDANWKWIFEENKSGKIEARHATITRPGFTIDTTVTTGWSMDKGWYKYAVTFVNRGDSIGVERLDQYAPGLLESKEDSAARVKVNITGDNSSVTLAVAWPNSYVMDPQITHVRFYRTDAAISEDTVDGLTLHWVADIPITHGVAAAMLYDKIRVSETDYPPETTDLDDAPAAARIYYHNGRLWFAGVPSRPRGNVYYTQIFETTALSPLKSLSHLDMTTNFVRVSSDSTEQAMAMGQANNDLYFMTENTVAYLVNGDPSGAIKTISATLGCPFFRSVVEYDQILVWLSPVGPVYAQNGIVDKMVQHKAGEVWLFSYNGKGYLHDKNFVPDRQNVLGFCHMGAYFLAYGRKIIGFYESPDKRVQGAFQVEMADPDMAMERVCILGPDQVVFNALRRPAWTSGSTIYSWQFFDSSAKTHCGRFYTLKQTFRRLYTDPKDPSHVSEPAVANLWANFTDNGQFKISINGDGFRWSKLFTYQERGLGSIQQHQDIDHRTVQVYKQPIPAVGSRASWYDVGWEKVFRPPYDFSAFGLSLKVIPRLGIPNDSLSIASGVDVPVDQGMLLMDQNYDSVGAT
jgi:hypothetical protein